MSHTFRGIPYPEVTKSYGWFHIADDKFGWFEAYTEGEVLSRWQDKVEAVLLKEALQAERYSRFQDSELLYCLRCGSAVFDIWIHDASHVKE